MKDDAHHIFSHKIKKFSLFKPHNTLPILWENNHYAILQKPSGLASHPGPKTTNSVETSLTKQKRGGPWLVHRLDRDTSGCLLIAKRKNALIKAQQAFATRKTQKIYWAFIEGKIAESQGEIKNTIKRITHKNSWLMALCPKTDPKAENAHTSWRLLGETTYKNRAVSWVELTLHTGRTHQARIHCASLGHPILGDKIYSRQETLKNALPLQLLAKTLRISLPECEIYGESQPEKEMKMLISQITPTFIS